MGRRLRIQVAGLYHVWDHAVERTPLFSDDADYLFRLGLLEQAVREGRLRCHALCLMGTHEHLLVTFEDDRLATEMQRLNRAYAGNFNLRNGRRGRVYWAPYGSKPVLSDAYLTELIRYLALNPEWDFKVRAEDYVWSSYGDLVGRRRTMAWVDPTPLLELFGAGERARERITQLVEDGRVLGRRRIERRL